MAFNYTSYFRSVLFFFFFFFFFSKREMAIREKRESSEAATVSDFEDEPVHMPGILPTSAKANVNPVGTTKDLISSTTSTTTAAAGASASGGAHHSRNNSTSTYDIIHGKSGEASDRGGGGSGSNANGARGTDGGSHQNSKGGSGIAGRQGSKGVAGGKTNDQDISGSFKFSNTILPQHVTATAQQLLPTSVLRNLYDKLYEKRKAAALEVEQIVKSLAGAGDLHRVHALLSLLVRDYALSPLSNHRKGKVEDLMKGRRPFQHV